MSAPAPRFANDDQAAQHWLTLLRNGTDVQKIQARERPPPSSSARGMFEEATDLLVSNVRAGVRNADVFRWLARLYRAQGDEVTSMQAAAEAAKYIRVASEPASPTPTLVMPASIPARDVEDDPLGFRRGAANPWHRRWWAAAGLSFLCFPIGLVLIWLNRGWSPRVRMVATAVVLIWGGYVLVSAGRSSGAPTATSLRPTSTITVNTPVAAQAAPATSVPVPPTATPTEAEMKAGFQGGLDEAWKREDWVHAIQAAQALVALDPNDRDQPGEAVRCTHQSG